MSRRKTFGRGLATSAQFALVVLLSTGFATTTHESIANTLPLLKVKAIVVAPTEEDLAAAQKNEQLDRSIGALSRRDAALYRVLFVAQQKGDWAKADALIEQLSEDRLIGHVLADRYEKRGASPAELEAWLRAYATLPDADLIYKKALRRGIKDLPLPQAAEAWRSFGSGTNAANFVPDLMDRSARPSSSEVKLGQAVMRALRQGKTQSAQDLVQSALAEGRSSLSYGGQAQGAIAHSLFRTGQHDAALSVAQQAAKKKNPTGLWLSGLILWEKGAWQESYDAFARLSVLDSLPRENMAAASFWAFRAASKLDQPSTAKKHLRAAATARESVYGVMAAHLLGLKPVEDYRKATHGPKWDIAARRLLAENEAGWRAMALSQIGQVARAEAELKRLNPQGDRDVFNAMLALTDHVPMPALSLKLGSMAKDMTSGLAQYPVLPWKPVEGYQIDRALIFALARHESLFNPNAISSRGAMGLMQIMPATANGLAKDQPEVMEMLRQNKLLDPAFNMALGQKYIQHLATLPQVRNNLVYLLAAYNAGPNKLAGWQAQVSSNDPLLFMESIPFAETRAYVARIIPHYWAYRARLGKSVPSLKQMASGQWPEIQMEEKAPHRLAMAEGSH
ncbi:MAG: lytic transglycosylase domain-containing protein [Alphaproteobacteria bacterium]|jgi:soluble lytic murein transglycosylase-like protein|nr:lytic transglycosylase domain-containing protein [Alphaproteobacteria bacterium]